MRLEPASLQSGIATASIRLRGTPEITDPLPQDLAKVFGRLVVALDETIPPRHLDRNLLVATWNLRAFGG